MDDAKKLVAFANLRRRGIYLYNRDLMASGEKETLLGIEI
jgi:hypothetical protein